MQERSNVQQFGGGRRLLESMESVSTIGKLPLYCMFFLILPFLNLSNTLEVAERFYVHMLLSSLPKRFVCVNFMFQKCTLKCMLWFFPSLKLPKLSRVSIPFVVMSHSPFKLLKVTKSFVNALIIFVALIPSLAFIKSFIKWAICYSI